MKLLTVGYGNRGKEGFLRLLRDLDVTHLIDVRTTPYSRYHHDFDREAIASALLGSQHKYVYMGDTLGGEASRIAGETHQIGLKVLYRKLYKEPETNACLMCGCLRAENCHRGIILGESFTDMGLEVLHADESDRLISQPNLRLRMMPVQLQLAL